MALPPGIVPKVVTFGIASHFDGTLAEGTVTITAPENVVDTATNRPIYSSQMSQRLVDGVATFSLCPTDAEGLNIKSWTYKLSVVINGALKQDDPRYFTLPTAGPDEIDLDSLVTVPSSAGTPISATVVTSVNGQTGDVTVEGGGGAAENVVVHGDVASTPRPDIDGPVVWFGTVDPVNSDDAQDVTVYVTEGLGDPAGASQGAVLPGTGGLTPVAGVASSLFATQTLGADPLRSFFIRHPILVPCSWIVLEYSNWYAQNQSGETNGPVDITVRAGVATSGGATVNETSPVLPVTFRGVDTVTIPAGGTVRSDPIFIGAQAGATIATRTTMTLASGSTYPWNVVADGGYATTDLSRTGTTYSGFGSAGYAPTRILGVPTGTPQRTFAICGDSITRGSYDDPQSRGGYEQAMTAANMGFLKVGASGERALDFVTVTKSARRMAMIAGSTDAIVEYGVNDIGFGRTLAQIQADLLGIYDRLTRAGVQRIWQTTITPNVTGAVGSQTPSSAAFAPGGTRSQLNAWIRANTAGIAGYIEAADAVETGRDTGIWQTAAYNDGVHPSPAGHVAIRDAIRAAVNI